MTAVLINPNLVIQENDPFTTGIVYMPIGLALVAATLKQANHPLKVIDAFGQAPKQGRRSGPFLIMGATIEEILKQIPAKAQVVFLYANQLINHTSLVEILGAIKTNRPKLPLIVLENTQAVTAYALEPVAEALLEAGADYLLTGEGEVGAPAITAILMQHGEDENEDAPSSGQATTLAAKLETVPGLIAKDFRTPRGAFISDLDQLPFPAWELFPVENYWSLQFAHGPLSSSRYLPLLTSRGCPFPCRFCVVPFTNERKWRARSPENVMAEMAHFQKSLGVSEFHIEDLNPTVQDRRTRGIARAIIDQGLTVTWKIVSGTKVESIKNAESIDLMAQSGCRYISISPESGSPEVLKKMAKPFNLDHAVNMIKRMNQTGIRSQACFVLGFPGETEKDLEMTRQRALEMTRGGVDEIALFIITPVPGSELFDSFEGYGSLSELNFTPSWREDYEQLARFRLNLYRRFLFTKLLYHPGKIIRQSWNFFRRSFETKMEMVPFKALVWKWVGRSVKD
ncbi:MAG: B12-binding domain-containing radical SAM protein [Magnetococcales bacterium]|nr:B12-binding domain-containing radical SAM protein [Magnetococcales bacterium]